MSQLPPLDIRRFQHTPEDRQRINGFFDSLDAQSRAFFNRGDNTRKDALRFFDQENEERDAHILRLMAVDKNGNMVGYLFSSAINSGVPGIGLGVTPRLQGKGLGMKLVQSAWNILYGKGARGMLLCTHHANLPAQSLYYKFGFEHFGTHPSGEMLFIYRHRE